MSQLYPLKFHPILKEKVWGGKALSNIYNKIPSGEKPIGESWEISAISDNLSVVSNGFLAGNNIEELIEVYMGEITGDSVFEKFGNEFPLLIKFIEANENLSVQVHPDNKLAKERHKAYGKTEMWHILKSKKGSVIYSGFIEGVTKETYQAALGKGNLTDILNVDIVKPGDTFFNPAGKIHAIGSGIVLIEIQQTSDITYRIYDWDRNNSGNNIRELHTDLALDAIDFSSVGSNIIRKNSKLNSESPLVNCEFFNTNFLHFNNSLFKEYYHIDSFVIYICIEGHFCINWDSNTENISMGETVLLPATIKEVNLVPSGEVRILEVFINSGNSF